MKAGRGYIIRLFAEKTNTAYFFTNRSSRWSIGIKYAFIFTDHATAIKMLLSIKKETHKKFKKGYLYISKVFYKEGITGGFNRGLIPLKLTKPDRHDFISAI